ncbi:hypothetical protein K2X92_01095 [Candidatus Gracilibacteria bacterium]|nr:hypothetical protein [Candidatus Gracilibacteria bacterium]
MEKVDISSSSQQPSNSQDIQKGIGISCDTILASWKEVKDTFFEKYPETEGIHAVEQGIYKILGTEGIQTNNIVAIPWYYMEESHRIFQVIEQLKGDSIAVIYFNGVPGKDQEEFNVRYNDLRRLIEKDNVGNKILLIKHAYKNRASLGSIRADMIGGIMKATSNAINDPIIYGFDADTYSLDPKHIINSEKVFRENQDVDFLRSQLRWNNGSKDGYAWFSEIMMHLLHSIQNKSHVVSMGGATAFRLRSYARVGGYKRGADMGEDIILGKDMKEENPNGGGKFGGKVYVDPRRGIQAVHEGRRFQDQWNGMKEYTFVDKGGIFTNDMITTLNQVVEDFINGKELSEIERMQFAGHIDGRYFVGKSRTSIQAIFIRFWNINMKQSLYRAALNEHGKVVFINK